MPSSLADGIRRTAFAFRGYNVTNLGRSDELLAHEVYGPTVERYLAEGGEICGDVVGRKVDLLSRVRERRETSLETYDEAIALVVAMELAQIRLLEENFGIDHADAQLTMGYSLGELTAVACSGVYDMAHALRIPLTMAADAAELALDCTMGVLFSRGPALSEEDVARLCLEINIERKGVIGVSAILSPNTLLLLGQGETVARFKERMHERLPTPVHLRPNPHRWPPLHTPITWQRNIPNRSAVMMQQMPGGLTGPTPPVLSLVTGKRSYNDFNAREHLNQWVDHPQRLWDGVYETLASGVETVVHVGPEPNLLPATYKRLADNVSEDTAKGSWRGLGLRAVSRLARLQWLDAILPGRAALLRAPEIRHVVLEDWLLEQPLPS